MTHLRKKMLEDLERRNYSASTARCYLRAVEDFARYFRRPLDQLGPAQIRWYQAQLFRDRKLADHTVAQRADGAALLLQQDARTVLECQPDTLPEEGLPTAERPQPAGGCSTHRGHRQRDPPRHRSAPGGVDPTPAPRHRQ